MPFFKESETKDPKLTAWAAKLRTATKRFCRIGKIGSILPWVQQLNKLRKAHGEELVGKVVDWYVDHAGEEFVPRVGGWVSFTNKFDQIVQAMQTVDDPREAVSVRSQEIAAGIALEYIFPATIQAQLPVLVQRTRDRWDTFMVSMTKMPLATRDRGFLETVCKYYAPCFADVWFKTLHQKYGWMENYTGIVLNLVFKPNSQLFRGIWRGWSLTWSGDAGTFDKLLDQLIKEKK